MFLARFLSVTPKSEAKLVASAKWSEHSYVIEILLRKYLIWKTIVVKKSL